MNKKVLFLLLILFATAAVTVAQPAPPPRGAAVLAKYLDLSPEQVAAWKQIHADTAATIAPLAEQARATQKELAAAMNAAPPDDAAIGKLALSLKATRDQIRAARKASETKLRATLNAEQQIKYDAFRAAVDFLKANRPRK